MKNTIRYSEAFKLQVLRSVEEGRFPSLSVAARAYGVSGKGTAEYWARKYSMHHLLGKVIKVETAKEIDEKKVLRQRVRDLEKALSDARLKEMFGDAYLEIACRLAGIEDVEDFKKKHAGRVRTR